MATETLVGAKVVYIVIFTCHNWHFSIGISNVYKEMGNFFAVAKAQRQYIRGIIHADKLQEATWFNDPSVSVIVQPDGVIEKEAIVAQSIKKVSLQLAGVGL